MARTGRETSYTYNTAQNAAPNNTSWQEKQELARQEQLEKESLQDIEQPVYQNPLVWGALGLCIFGLYWWNQSQ